MRDYIPSHTPLPLCVYLLACHTGSRTSVPFARVVFCTSGFCRFRTEYLEVVWNNGVSYAARSIFRWNRRS